MKLKSICNLVLSSFLFFGCASSIEKAHIDPTTNPSVEMTHLKTEISKGYENHYDVLAEKDFKQGIKYFNKAKEGLRKDRKQQDILSDLAYRQRQI